MTSVYEIGTKVRKPKGYPFEGIVVGKATKLDFEMRVVVESTVIPGLLHIFEAKQLEVVEENREVLPGQVYRHWRGGKYMVHRVISDQTSGRESEKVVLYEPVDPSTVSFCVRELADFLGYVHPSGVDSMNFHDDPLELPHCRVCHPRFELVK